MTTNPGSETGLASSFQKSSATWLDFFNVISPQPDMDSVSRAPFSMERMIRDSIQIMQKMLRVETSYQLSIESIGIFLIFFTAFQPYKWLMTICRIDRKRGR
jgi:hypothetical protein